MRVVITAATKGEWEPCLKEFNKLDSSLFAGFQVIFHTSGVGMLATAVSLMKLIYESRPDLIIQAGIAGSFAHEPMPGSVVVIREEISGDLGVEEAGQFLDLFDLQLADPDKTPFSGKRLPNNHLELLNVLRLPEVTGISVNEITTDAQRIEALVRKYKPETESMEGAALHFVCREMDIPFLQLRAISNRVGERDKKKWKIREAVENLNRMLLSSLFEYYRVFGKQKVPLS